MGRSSHWRAMCDCPDRPSYGFNELIRKIIKAFYSAKDTHERMRVEVFLYCPSGQKRSVSMARILTDALRHHGYKVYEQHHHSVNVFEGHYFKCQYCSDDQWPQPSEKRMRLLDWLHFLPVFIRCVHHLIFCLGFVPVQDMERVHIHRYMGHITEWRHGNTNCIL